jgi:hypothetical protein
LHSASIRLKPSRVAVLTAMIFCCDPNATVRLRGREQTALVIGIRRPAVKLIAQNVFRR